MKPEHPYEHSPKAIVIAGAPAAGKSTVARQLASEYGYRILSLDAINVAVISQLGVEIEAVRTPAPEIVDAYKKHFLEAVRALRFSNIGVEGCRVSHPHIFETFRQAVFTAYGEYALVRPFYLNPDDETRKKHYLLRQAQLAKRVSRDKDMTALKLLQGEYAKGYCQFLEPVLPGFEVVRSAEDIYNWAEQARDARHPDLPAEHADLIKDIAESGAFNPFYQRVDMDGHQIISGFTDSEKSWDNIKGFNIDFTDKKCCDIGCMLGYYSFKIEEAGGASLGVDLDQGAVDAANLIARAKGSACSFKVFDVTNKFDESFDLTMALNVLHRVSDFPLVCRNIFDVSDQLVLEVGEVQVKDLLSISKEFNLKMKKAIKSHRRSSVVGQRILLHLGK